jgi:predicted transglutaminase-like cysteine proteinase
MTLEQFNQQYKYQTDKEKYCTSLDIWEIPKLQENGFYYGDCESYCRFLKENISEFKDWDYYYCKLNGAGHCILYKNTDMIDCNTKKIVSLVEYSKLNNITKLKRYSWFVVFSKIVFSYFYVKIKRK